MPYVRVCCPASLLVLLGFVGLVELLSFLTIGAAQGKTLVLFGSTIDVHAITAVADLDRLPAGRRRLAAREAAGFQRVWEGLIANIKPSGARQ